MLKIGVTGGIGSGKSTVCEIFKQLGIPVFNSDFEANKLIDTSATVDFYKNEFGDIVFTNNSLDKQKIASLIFNNPEALQKVNDFIHPKVNENFVNWVNKQKNCLYVIKESALLLDLKTKQDLNYIILVHAPLELRIKRVMLRDGTDKETILKRVKNQSPDEEKMKKASHIISNDDHSLLLSQVLALHNMYLKEAQNLSQ